MISTSYSLYELLWALHCVTDTTFLVQRQVFSSWIWNAKTRYIFEKAGNSVTRNWGASYSLLMFYISRPERLRLDCAKCIVCKLTDVGSGGSAWEGWGLPCAGSRVPEQGTIKPSGLISAGEKYLHVSLMMRKRPAITTSTKENMIHNTTMPLWDLLHH